MTLLDAYWPIRDEINRCIKAEAETVTDAVLLAVHQPTPLAIREAGSLTENPVTEHELLEAFLIEDLPEGTLLLPITGASGVGKSHIIRWLAAQLNRVKDDRGLEVIRIPKSANLRSVVELILEPLSDDNRYAAIRDKLEKVISEVTPQDGAIRFVAELKISLRNLAEDLITQIRNNPGASGDREQRLRLDHARKLPAFFSDAELQEYFESSILAPIIERSIRGRNVDAGDDELLPQFSADDLIVPDSLELGHASRSVRTYYQTTLNREGGKGREIAADVLNSVIDDAIRRVFNLDQAIGGVTLEDIILHIRDLLFEDGRELVLLIEDFAALSGIQEILLNICIQEAVRDGKQVRSPMRTALAVTDGYLANRDTILTRAKREWLIRSTLDDPNDAMERSINLVGAYLNAARWGEKELQRMFTKSRKDSEAGLTKWISTFDDPGKSAQEADLLAAFETNSRGESLFPFNRTAIPALAELHLKVSGQIVFNPRRVINYILRDVLLLRDTFEQERFPPPHFQHAIPSANVAAWLTHATLGDDVSERMKSFVVYWGGHPQTPEQVAAMSPELFKTFALPTPEDLGQVRSKVSEVSEVSEVSPEPYQTKSKIQASGTKKSKTPIENTAVNEWQKKLNAWAGGRELQQQDANKLRTMIRVAVEKYIDWNSLCMAKRDLRFFISIPNAKGEGNKKQYKHFVFQVATDHTDPSGMVRNTLLAAVRYESAGNTWEYPGGDLDSALFANLVEDIGQRLLLLLSDDRDKEIAFLASILVRQGRILGILPKRLKYPDALASVIVAESPQLGQMALTTDASQQGWGELRAEVIQLRKDFQGLLLDRIACFQGAGKKAFAIDTSKLPKNILDDEIQFELPQALKAHVVKLTPRRLGPRTRPLIENVRNFYDLTIDALGESLDKNVLISVFKELLDILELTGVWPDGDFPKQRLRDEIEAFRQTSLKDLLDQVTPLLNADLDFSGDTAIYCLGRLDLSVLGLSQRFLDRTEEFIDAAEQLVEVQSRSFKGIDPEEDAKAIEQKLEILSSDLKEIASQEVTS